MPRRLFPWCIGCALAFTTTSCSKQPNVVSGTVTLGQTQFVTGANLILIDLDGKEYAVPINPAGSYVLEDPPLGNVRVKVVSVTDSMGPMKSASSKDDLPERASDRGPKIKMTMPTHVIVPKRYGNADSGLTMQIGRGHTVNDINLEP